MTRERLIWLLTALALAAGGWWVTLNTEWVEETRPRAAEGEARDNPVYALEQLLRQLGMQVSHHEALDALPPPRARLLMLSRDWQLMRERAAQLQRWVRSGGHLVLVEGSDWESKALADWMPVEEMVVQEEELPAPRTAASAAAAASAVAGAAARNRVRLVSTPAVWEGADTVETCGVFYAVPTLRPKAGHAPSWTLTGIDAKPYRSGAPLGQVVRVAVGEGSVTVLNTRSHAFTGTDVLDCGNPLLLAASLQAEPGATAWIYLQERREALLPWLWRTGWIAVLVGLLALAAALWRAAVRFGPRAAAAPRLRRSISEQVQGLAAYLHGSGREALLAAQQRALNEVAARTLPRYARLPAAERVRVLANATGLARDELTVALTARFCTRAELLKYLPLLEAARRRLHKSPEERRPP